MVFCGNGNLSMLLNQFSRIFFHRPSIWIWILCSRALRAAARAPPATHAAGLRDVTGLVPSTPTRGAAPPRRVALGMPLRRDFWPLVRRLGAPRTRGRRGEEGRDAGARAWLRELRDVLYELGDAIDDGAAPAGSWRDGDR